MNQAFSPAEDLIKVSEAASILGVNPTTVLRWIDKNYLKPIRYPSGGLRIPRIQINKLLESNPEKKEKTYKIMVIDDEEYFLESLESMLETIDMPLEIFTYTDGLTALLDIANINPDVILIDCVLTNIDGALLSQKIREKQEYKDIPQILMSGQVDAQPENASELDVFLKKPFSAGDIEQVLKDKLMAATERKL